MKKVSLLLLLTLCIVQLLAQSPINEDAVHRNFIINVVPDKYNKPLIGIANFAFGNHKGFQSGIFNWNQNNFNGFQISVLNIVKKNTSGLQIGVVNTCADSLKGIQLGFINATKNRNGTQIGLINYADTVTSGSGIALLSFVRKGYQALELGVSEMYPFNLSYKIGLKNAYNSVNYSFKDAEYPVFGFGLGTMVFLNKHFYINPDFSLQNGILKSKQGIMSLIVKFSYAITKKIHISAGPSAVWSYAREGIIYKPLYSIYEYPIDERNKIVIGLRCSIRYNFRGL